MRANKILFLSTRTGLVFIVLSVCLIIFTVIAGTLITKHVNSSAVISKSIIIDPGHGGIDGGTNDGTTFFEKDINLQISKKLREMLAADNIDAAMSRESDISLDGLEDKSNGDRHVKDLINRVVMFNSGKYDIFVSIHVNYSTDSRAIGPLVLYSGNIGESRQLAESIQNELNRYVKSVYDMDTDRRPAASNLFILKNSNIPGVIVETGFISNLVEKKLLQDEACQEKIAKSICQGLIDYLKK